METAEKVEMPPCPTEFAIGGQLEAGTRLLRDQFFDRRILDRFKLNIVEGTRLMATSGHLEFGWTEKTSDNIGAKRRVHHLPSLFAGPEAQLGGGAHSVNRSVIAGITESAYLQRAHDLNT
jgi:hypothetical protein